MHTHITEQGEKMKRLVLMLLMILFFSCSEVNETESTDPNAALLNFLSESGFKTDNAIFEEDHIIIEGDIAFSISDLKKRMQQRGKQWRTQYQISDTRVRDIKVKFHKRLKSAWVESGRAAIAQLNAVPNSAVFLREVTSGEDILVQHSGRVSSARGEFPSSDGKAGYSILIGRKISPTGYYSNTMLHELGHNIGLRHDHAPDEGIDPSQQIAGTPYSDPYSVMSYNSNRYFTDYDKLAISVLYPE